jgi:ribosomal protein S18 acetylase RimI-like enzyme
VARMLHDFNSEYEDFTPGVELLKERIDEMMRSGDITVLLAGEGPEGFALLRFQPSFYTRGLEAYLAELYVAPGHRYKGIGRALLREVLDHCRERGTTFIYLGTSTDDEAARALYESEGFTDREGDPDGPQMLFYEREL